jgi:hypothetical protein
VNTTMGGGGILEWLSTRAMRHGVTSALGRGSARNAAEMKACQAHSGAEQGPCDTRSAEALCGQVPAALAGYPCSKRCNKAGHNHWQLLNRAQFHIRQEAETITDPIGRGEYS